jgi:hypothetical protein
MSSPVAVTGRLSRASGPSQRRLSPESSLLWQASLGTIHISGQHVKREEGRM